MDDQSLRVRPFERARDDSAVKELEQSALQGPPGYQRWLAFATWLPRSFDAKALQYPLSCVLVCEDTATGGTICGVVCVGIKTVFMQGVATRLAYLFDLRVHSSYQRRGIGRQLQTAIERWCVDSGASTIYLSVNQDNSKAVRLYEKLGYGLASTRRPQMTMLLSLRASPRLDTSVSVTTASEAEVAALLRVRYAQMDGAPDDFSPLIRSEFYLQSYVARRADGPEWATCSLWNAGAVGGMGPMVVLLPVAVWRRTSTRLVLGLLLIAAVAAAVTGSRALVAAGYVACGRYVLPAVAMLVLTPIVAFVLFIQYIFHKFATQKQRARVFAACCHPPESAKAQAMLTEALIVAKNAAASLGYLEFICNVSEKESTLGALKAAGLAGHFVALFMSKRLGSAGAGCAPFDDDMLFDPRDI